MSNSALLIHLLSIEEVNNHIIVIQDTASSRGTGIDCFILVYEFDTIAMYDGLACGRHNVVRIA